MILLNPLDSIQNIHLLYRNGYTRNLIGLGYNILGYDQIIELKASEISIADIFKIASILNSKDNLDTLEQFLDDNNLLTNEIRLLLKLV